MRLVMSVGRSGFVLLWAFRVWAQFGTEPIEQGWVATATHDACDAGQRLFLDVARAYGTTVNLGDCRKITPDDLRRPVSESSRPAAPAADYHGIPSGPSRGPRPDRR